MRYDSPDHLATWSATGRFPAIHDAIAQVAAVEMTGRRVLDLGCSYGLLGGRLMSKGLADFALGVDTDLDVMDAGLAAGLPVEYRQIKVDFTTIDALVSLISEHRIDVLVARRIMPELFGDNLPLGVSFGIKLASAGVREVLLEGRVQTSAAVNALSSVDKEVGLFTNGGYWVENYRARAVSYLVRCPS